MQNQSIPSRKASIYWSNLRLEYNFSIVRGKTNSLKGLTCSHDGLDDKVKQTLAISQLFKAKWAQVMRTTIGTNWHPVNDPIYIKGNLNEFAGWSTIAKHKPTNSSMKRADRAPTRPSWFATMPSKSPKSQTTPPPLLRPCKQQYIVILCFPRFAGCWPYTVHSHRVVMHVVISSDEVLDVRAANEVMLKRKWTALCRYGWYTKARGVQSGKPVSQTSHKTTKSMEIYIYFTQRTSKGSTTISLLHQFSKKIWTFISHTKYQKISVKLWQV